MRQVLLYADREDGGWIAEVPSLPGCVSQGESKEEALAEVQDAIAAWVSAAQADGRKVPEETFDAEIVKVSEKL